MSDEMSDSNSRALLVVDARLTADELSQAIVGSPTGCPDRSDNEWSNVSEGTLTVGRSPIDRRRSS